ncbi:MAG TPA: glycoside hydrolase family 43 protein [Devosiaceae bacterium]
MPLITNPILPGFNPDPSICRVGDDYYIATSTFEWYPGVQLHHSRDLVNWRLLPQALNRKSQLDMRGEPDSCGVWAPNLQYADGLFWLIYTDVRRYDGNYKDVFNYLVTASSIEGPWSDPVYLNSSGFDPGMFHDDDGRKWLLNMVWDHRATKGGSTDPARLFHGIVMQEYDHAEKRLVGPARRIFHRSPLGMTEGPNLTKHDGWYYLTVAEGGTGYNHAVTHARSRDIWGPYELHPDIHVITSRHAPDWPLQRAGHGQMVELPDGSVYHTHLCSRPLRGPDGTRRSPMGRETAIQKMYWGEDGWLHRSSGRLEPDVTVEAPNLPPAPVPDLPTRDDFDAPRLSPVFQWLRTPERDRIFSLTARPGHLRLYGRESIGSWYEQALVARRQTDFRYTASTTVEFSPRSFQQMAGLTAYYARDRFHYLHVTADDAGNRILSIQACVGSYPDYKLQFPLENDILLPEDGPVHLKVEVDRNTLQFFYATEEADWRSVGPVLDASILSDEAGKGEHGSFTGAFVGMAAQDLTGQVLAADFDHFTYEAG